MKILLIPLDYHLHTKDPQLFGDMFDAFAKECEAMMFDGYMEKAFDFKPDVIFYQGSLTAEERKILKDKTGALWMTWTGDVRYAPMKSLIEVKDVTDVYLVPFEGKMLEYYEAVLGKPCKYIFEPLHEWKLIEPKVKTEGKITFVGNSYDHLPGGIERMKIQGFLNLYFKDQVNFYGSPNPSISNKDVPALYNDSYIVIAENNWRDVQGYFTPRNLLAMANSCCVAREFPDCEWHFKNYEHCIYYKHKYELLDIINMLKECPEVRNRIAQAGYNHIKEGFTYAQWVKKFKIISEYYILKNHQKR